MIGLIIVIVFLGFGIWGVYTHLKSKPKAPKEFPAQWREILLTYVKHYKALDTSGRERFENDVLAFLGDVHITPVKCEIDDKDKVLVAAGAVIPFLGFPEFGYPNLDRVLIYPGRFNFEHEFGSEAKDKRILGMVGTGYMNRTMILSKPDLYAGFAINNDKKNVSIHEFIHLMDMADGAIDGIPSAFLDKPYILPWMEVMATEIERIQKGKSDIRDYGAFNKQEFLAVTSEYFFEAPVLMRRKHPKLYALLAEIYQVKKK